MDVSTAAYALPDRELVLDRYRPLRPLGRGGSGSVWLARDERSGLEIALKIVPREGKRAARAMREMEAASRLRHERCVRAYDFGGDDGHVYIAYEYVRGSTMRELLRAGKVTDRDAIEVAAQVLEGLAHAHQRGIVHRDVKPSNILVEEGDELSVRLLDFGLAQFDEADTLTAMGDVPGTLAYIAPERLRGKEASAKSDVWAVGVLLWEALAGQHPFWGVPLPQVAATISGGAPPLASQRPDLPRRLLALVDRALSVDPAARPPAKRLALELREAAAAPPRRARNPKRAGAKPVSVRTTRRPSFPAVPPVDRVLQAGLAAAATALGATVLPFWTPGLAGALAVAAAAASFQLPRVALAIALFAPVFGLGNLAEGAALAYAALAAAWLAAMWSDARKGLLFWAGPLLAAVGLIALLPLAVQPARGAARRVLLVVGGVLTAALVAGVDGSRLPFSGEAPAALDLAGEESPWAVTAAVWSLVSATPGLLAGTAVLAAVAIALPWARRRGRAEVALLAAIQLVALVAWAPGTPLLGAAAGSLLLAVLGGLPSIRASIRGRLAASAAG